LLPTSTVDPRKAENDQFLYVDIEAVDNQRQSIVNPKLLAKADAPSRARNLVFTGDVLFSLVRPYLKNIAIVPTELNSSVASTAFFVCRPGPGMDSRFLLNYFRTQTFIESVTTYGSSPPAARDEEFERLPILIAPSAEQERIADELDELLSDLDAGVEGLQNLKTKLARYRASVLKAAVEGTLTSEWRQQHPHTEPASELLKSILADRRRRWDEEQLCKFKEKGQKPPENWQAKYREPVAPLSASFPTLPSTWCRGSLDQLFRIERGRFSIRPRNDPRYYGGTIPFLQIGDLPRDGGAIRHYAQTLNAAGLAVSKCFPAGSVLIAIVGATIGNTGVLTFDSCCPDSLVALHSAPAPLLRFAEAFLRTKKLSLRVGASASGGQPNINLEMLQPLPVPLPPLREVEAIIELVEEQLSVLEHLKDDLDAKLQSARMLRHSILRQAFTGRLVAQNPGDEPASELLKRIAAERETRASEAAAAKRVPVQTGAHHLATRRRRNKRTKES
jgi:type I restriction enzyme S subunit